jgi:hypothetical protein
VNVIIISWNTLVFICLRTNFSQCVIPYIVLPPGFTVYSRVHTLLQDSQLNYELDMHNHTHSNKFYQYCPQKSCTEKTRKYIFIKQP